jgi:hypothetical protein
MANIVTYGGASSFAAGQTPFGFYDTDSTFQTDADKVARFCATKLGWPLMDVELQSGSFYAAFEEAVTTYGNEVYAAIIKQNFLNLQGSDQSQQQNNVIIKPNLNEQIRYSQQYGTEAEVGGSVTKHSGLLDVVANQQDYDLDQWAIDNNIEGGIEIRRIFYEAPPAILRYFDPYAGTGTGIQSLMDAFDFGSYSPGVNFLLMPASYDMLKVQAIEFNDQIRRSAYSFEILNNKLTLFPIPAKSGTLRIEYYKLSEKYQATEGTLITNNSESGCCGVNPVTNIFNANFKNPVYADINSVGRDWIYRYAAALAKEMLAYIRGKYQTVPVPGSEATLNQAELLTDARAEKAALLEQLRQLLEGTSRVEQMEQQVREMEANAKMITGVPMTIYVG